MNLFVARIAIVLLSMMDVLKKHGDLFLSDDLNNYQGQQYTQSEKDIFGCFSDALPDHWGRTLLLRREQIVAMEEKRPVRRLFPFDYLIGIDDFSRMGAFYCRNDFPFGTKLG